MTGQGRLRRRARWPDAKIWQGHGTRRRNNQHTRRLHGRADRSRRGREIHASRHHCGRASKPVRQRHGSRRRHLGRQSQGVGMSAGSPTCRKGWARISIPTLASARTSSFLADCSDNPATSASGGSPNCSTAPGWHHSRIVRRRSCQEACGRNSACAARSFTIPIC